MCAMILMFSLSCLWLFCCLLLSHCSLWPGWPGEQDGLSLLVTDSVLSLSFEIQHCFTCAPIVAGVGKVSFSKKRCCAVLETFYVK